MSYQPEELTKLAARLSVAADVSESKAKAHLEANEPDLAERELNRAESGRHFVRVCHYFEKWIEAMNARIAEEAKVKEQSKTAAEYSASFLDFWKAYPRKVGKEDAWRKWQRLKCGQVVLAVTEGLKAAKASDAWTKDGGQFIPHPATWLNRKGWLDEHATANTPAPSKALVAATAKQEDPAGWQDFLEDKLDRKYVTYAFAPNWMREQFKRSKE